MVLGENKIGGGGGGKKNLEGIKTNFMGGQQNFGGSKCFSGEGSKTIFLGGQKNLGGGKKNLGGQIFFWGGGVNNFF